MSETLTERSDASPPARQGVRIPIWLKIEKTFNADLPLKHGVNALLTIDVWEHAYYIDYRNARPDYISNFLQNLVNWDFVGQNLAAS